MIDMVFERYDTSCSTSSFENFLSSGSPPWLITGNDSSAWPSSGPLVTKFIPILIVFQLYEAAVPRVVASSGTPYSKL